MSGSPAHFRRASSRTYAEHLCPVFQSAPASSRLGPAHPTTLSPITYRNGSSALDAYLGRATSRLLACRIGSTERYDYVWMTRVANTLVHLLNFAVKVSKLTRPAKIKHESRSST